MSKANYPSNLTITVLYLIAIFSEYFTHYINQDITCSSNGRRSFLYRLTTLELSVGIFYYKWQQVLNLESDAEVVSCYNCTAPDEQCSKSLIGGFFE